MMEKFAAILASDKIRLGILKGLHGTDVLED